MNHLPIQPSWRCHSCGMAWPCPAACAQLRTEFADDLVALAMYLARCMIDAAGDRVDLPAGDLHRRFLGWIRVGH